MGTVVEPAKDKGKFCFQVFLTSMGKGDGDSLGEWGPFDTEKECQQEMRKVCELVSETITEKMSGKPSGKYLDLQTNELRDWKQH